MKKSKVIFDGVAHTYFLNGEQLKGITGTLLTHALGNKYVDVPASVLENARKKGKRIHEEIEMYINGFAPAEPSDEFVAFANLCKKFVESEFVVSDEKNFATPIDLIDEECNLYDVKTTYALDLDYLSWQLSICAYFFELQGNKANKLYGIHLRGNDAKIVEVERKKDAEVQRLIECYLNDISFVNDVVISEEQQLAKLIELEQAIILIELEASKAKEQRDALLKGIEQKMVDSGTKKIETEKLIITRVLPTESVTFDSKRFLEENPQVAEKYSKTSVRKGYIKIKIK